jgi:hypothetical protein
MPDAPPAPSGQLVLKTLLDRLMAGLLNGPAMNCRPHNSRQRIDLASMSDLPGVNATDVLRMVLGADQTAKVSTKIKGSAPRRFAKKKTDDASAEPQDDAAQSAGKVVSKLRVMSDDAVTYKQDTGVHVLAVGFPLLTLPPGALGKDVSRRVVAPIAFVPVDVTLTRGVSTSIEVSCYGEGAARVIPNVALFAWLQRLAGKDDLTSALEDETGERPLREITLLVNEVCKALELKTPDFLPANHEAKAGDDAPDLQLPEGFQLSAAPRTDQLSDEAKVLPSAVLGLFPMANQGLIEDMKALAAGDGVSALIEGYLKAGIALDTPATPPPLPTDPKEALKSAAVGPTSVNLVSDADPCQRQVIRLSQGNQGVVVHGPPGTGKSQTIVNIVGDALMRDQRVLFVSDKRTALDVVLNRLSFVGLGDLCAVVHDPQKDQRDLYRVIREQLTSLGEAKIKTRTLQEQAAIDEELKKLHGELTAYHRAIMDPPTQDGLSFHELVGRWLSLPDSVPAGVDASALDGIGVDDLAKLATPLRELFDRATSTEYAKNPWAGVATTDIGGLLARNVDEVKQAVAALGPVAEQADATLDPAMPPFADGDLAAQVKDRVQLAQLLEQTANAPEHVGKIVAGWDDATLARLQPRLAEGSQMLARVKQSPLDLGLEQQARTMTGVGPADWGRVSQQLQEYIDSQKGWFGGMKFGAKNAGAEALKPFGLALSPENATKLKTFIDAYRDRVTLTFLLNELNGVRTTSNVALPDDQLIAAIDGYLGSVQIRSMLASPSLLPLRDVVVELLNDRAKPRAAIVSALRASGKRAEAIDRATGAFAASKLVSDSGVKLIRRLLCENQPFAPRAKAMLDRVDTLESVARLEKSLTELPSSSRAPIAVLLQSGMDVAGAQQAIEKRALAAEIRKRLTENPSLQATDPQKLETMMARLVELEKQRQELLRDNVVSKWVKKARDRLYADGRMNDRGKALERRFLLSGKNAMRLRKVIQQGAQDEGGDPMFDLRPVWMASPETVAQLFARKPVFDVVIFDEASQCRLEESLPVLARGRRVVVAGDEQQLPPTRFFESSVGDDDAEDDEDKIATDQDLFERQQAKTEDLLGASLQLQVQQAYLDVHYRSKNADLIEFSNRYFYRSRLQAIPSHPDKRAKEPPIKLYRVAGVFEKSVNEPEAKQIVAIVKELLSKPEKDVPSIGIACMNVQQRDEILQELDDAATEDEAFGKKLDAAKQRMGKGSFEGLFVKNLENVQGDERDEMIISTTYGPDKAGKFFQRFGPLQQQGGGRRLNVLVTRARARVHLITSIPATQYRNLPAIPEGAAPSGGWLLYAYLKYAEELEAKYAAATETVTTKEKAKPTVETLDKEELVSPLAQAIANRLASELGVASALNWGNEGFRVDLALHDPAGTTYPVGVLCDGTRYAAVDDPVGWDVFRSGVCRQQGWALRRIWSPHLWRDPAGTLKRLAQASGATPP